MPVDDHPVHPKTIQAAGTKYGCNNHKRKPSHYYAPNRIYRNDGTFINTIKKIRTEWIEYAECPAGSNHPGCDGCIHKGGNHE